MSCTCKCNTPGKRCLLLFGARLTTFLCSCLTCPSVLSSARWIAAAESAQRHLNSRSDLQPNVKVEHMQQLSNGLQQRRTCLTTCQKNKKIEEANQRTSQGHSQNNNSQNAVVRYQPQPQQQQQQQLVQSSQLQAGYQQHQGQVQYRHQQLASAQQHHQVTGYRITQTNTAQIYGPNNQVIGGYSVQSTAFGAGAMPQIR